MILIIGGAYQGKLDFAKTFFHLEDKDVYTCQTETELPQGEKAIVNAYHKLVLSQTRNQIDPMGYAQQRLPFLQGKIIICEDVFCGIVPLDPQTRLFRENYARCLNYLAKEASNVYRVFCGLATKIK